MEKWLGANDPIASWALCGLVWLCSGLFSPCRSGIVSWLLSNASSILAYILASVLLVRDHMYVYRANMQ